MATNIPATIQLSTPQVIVNDYVLPIVPNSLKVRIPGEAKVRAMSAGGGSVQTVRGLDASSLIGKVDFKIANTAANYAFVQQLKDDMINGIGCTIKMADNNGFTLAFQDMGFTKDTEAEFKADGDIACEFEGTYVRG